MYRSREQFYDLTTPTGTGGLTTPTGTGGLTTPTGTGGPTTPTGTGGLTTPTGTDGPTTPTGTGGPTTPTGTGGPTTPTATPLATTTVSVPEPADTNSYNHLLLGSKTIELNYAPADVEDSGEQARESARIGDIIDTEAEETATCGFVAYGTSKDACYMRCSNVNDRMYWGGDSCTYNKCREICNACKDKVNCDWLKPEQIISEGKEDKLPEKVTINAIAGNTKVLLIWKATDKKDYPNTGFVIQYFKTYKPFEGVRMVHVRSNEIGSYRITITNLANNEYYNFGVYSINKIGMSTVSNIETAVPTEKLSVTI